MPDTHKVDPQQHMTRMNDHPECECLIWIFWN